MKNEQIKSEKNEHIKSEIRRLKNLVAELGLEKNGPVHRTIADLESVLETGHPVVKTKTKKVSLGTSVTKSKKEKKPGKVSVEAKVKPEVTPIAEPKTTGEVLKEKAAVELEARKNKEQFVPINKREKK